MTGRTLLIGALLMTIWLPLSPLDCLGSGESKPDSAEILQAKLAMASNQFGVSLYQQLRETEKENIFIAPYSITSALAMTWAGANGETATEMAHVLGLDTMGEDPGEVIQALNMALENLGDVEMNVANSLWPSTQFEMMATYRERMKKFYDVDIETLDYAKETEASRQRINEWVEIETREKIKDLITPGALDPMTMMVLVNAIYFKGNWVNQFDTSRTSEGLFKNGDCKAQVVKMMHQKADYRYTEIEDLKILELPYVGDRLAMTLLLPPDNKSLAAVEKALTMDKLNTWFKQMRKTKVDVSIPRFTLSWGSTDLTTALKNMGIKLAFSGNADFTKMAEKGGINIDMVLHKTFIEVNEEGSEAAGATAVIMRKTAMIHPATFNADHPFLYMIRDTKTGTILFMGRLLCVK